MRHLMLGIAAALALGVASAVPAAAEQQVRIGTEADYAPFEWKGPDGKLHGMEIELGDVLCQRAKLSCQWVNMDFDSMIAALGAHQIDAVLSQMSITPAREEKVAFTNPITQAPPRFVAAKDSGITDNLDSLKGKTVGVQSGTTHEVFAKTKLAQLCTIKVYQTQDQAFQDLKAGRIDVTLADSTIEYDWMRKEGKGFEYVGPALDDPEIFGTGTGIALRKSDTALREKFNAALAEVKQDGTFKKINDEYFPFSIMAK
ncbi:MAG TPA: lysine/arginine/ornithine ABC transporter substrate-binding protein [Acetobacteraceae bacterium]|nr:lysine/arginine/ornithine ABC transporter substrate-binding protein [Acetobacteraceae bacterium]